jgi:hypothetical protein
MLCTSRGSAENINSKEEADDKQGIKKPVEKAVKKSSG